MYFDAVLDTENGAEPIHSGHYVDVLAWLRKHEEIRGPRFSVCVGIDLDIMNVEEYLESNDRL